MASDDKIFKALEKFEQKLDTLDSRLDSVDKTLVKQEANLGEHMRRTDLAEQSIAALHTDLGPIKKHVAYMEGGLKATGVLATVVAIISGIVRIFI